MPSRRIAIPAAIALSGFLAGPTAAVTGAASISMQSIPGGAKVCAIGNAADPFVGGTWLFTINGAIVGVGEEQHYEKCVLAARPPSPSVLLANLSFVGASGTPADTDTKGFIWG